ncbi:hypothetical protein [Candidatus Parabeggiatoa sp. HSG14]|uniref:hypothetical protein n=1 Tax=Candidatus Parabeggiatoa sp. HSG14 TaxID=3055593 RepID=UPI0025A6F74E|nr:hypothetical protein [Thiotrichales bacterium HSG14]
MEFKALALYTKFKWGGMRIDSGNLKAELRELNAQYEAGLYTRPELIWVVIDLMSQSMTDENWRSLPQWLQIQIVATMRNFSEKKKDRIIFGSINPEIVIQQNKVMKEWLTKKGYLNC